MKHVEFSNAATVDLADIFAYSARTWSPKQATKYAQTLRTTCEDLAQRRRVGHIAHDIRPDLMRFYSGSHTIYFRFTGEKSILVSRILHQSMDAPNQL